MIVGRYGAGVRFDEIEILLCCSRIHVKGEKIFNLVWVIDNRNKKQEACKLKIIMLCT
jgi:hypothetical protein